MGHQTIRRRSLLIATALSTFSKSALARFFRGAGGSTGPGPQTITGITIAGSSTAANFQAATANANCGVVSVTTSDNSVATISLPSGGNTNGFHLDGTTSGSHVLAPAGGLAASPPTYSLQIQASGPYSNSPQTITVTLTAIAAGTLQVSVNGVGPTGSPAAVISNDSIWVNVQNVPAGLGLNVNVILTDHTQTANIQEVTVPNPAPTSFDIVLPLTENNPSTGGQRPISSTPNTYYVVIIYQGSGTIRAASAAFTINPYLAPPFPNLAANAQIGSYPIIYMSITTTPTTNRLFADNAPGAGQVSVVKGTSVTVAITSYRDSSGGHVPSNVWAQFLVFGPGLPASGANLGPQVFAAGGYPSVTFDSTSSTLFPSGDGTYMVSVRIIDIADGVNFGVYMIPAPLTMIIQNVAAKPVVGTYAIPTASMNGNAHVLSPGIDRVTYSFSGTGPPVQPQDFPYPGPGQSVVNTLPVWNSASTYNPATGGVPTNTRTASYYGETLCYMSTSEYSASPRFTTTPVGGVCVVPWASESAGPGNTVEVAYPGAATQSYSDGGRNSCTFTVNTNMAATPETGLFSAYHWTIVQLDGRVAVVDLTGKMLTIAGPKQDPSLLPMDWQYNSNPESPNSIFVGTIAAPPHSLTDLGSANDVCWDPRNSNILYIACPVDHKIIKADFTGNSASAPNPVLSLYAGQEGVGGYVDGAAIGTALFNGPYSICMVKNTVNATYPKGTMFVADNYNSLIRVISADGSTVSTLTGHGDGNFAIPPASANAMTTEVQSSQTVSVTSITANGDGTTSAVVLSGTAPVFPFAVQAVGWKVRILVNGGNYTSGVGNNSAETPYAIYTVSAFTDSQHFSLYMKTPPSGGTITAVLHAADTFSNPNPVPFATAYTSLPFVIRMASTGDIVLGEAWYNIMARRIWLSGANSGKVTRIGPTGNLADDQANGSWAWLDVDDGVGADGVVHAYGACGPIDDIVMFKFDSNPGSAATAWRWSLDGTYNGGWPGQRANNWPAEGAYGVGHYPWGFAFSKSQLRFFSVGKGLSALTSWRQLLPADPAWNSFDALAWPSHDVAPDGWAMGSAAPFPFGMRPSFAALYGQAGWALFGSNVIPTLDQLQVTYPNDYTGTAGTVLATYIQNGAGGAVPRPEFAINGSGVPGRPLAYLIYMMRRQSLMGSYPALRAPLYKYGNGVGAGMLATANSVSLNYIRPQITAGPTATRTSPTNTSINVTWTTNVSTLSTVAGGSPNSFASAAYKYSVWSQPESAFATSHNMTITGLPDASLTGMSPTHIVVLGIDQDGNGYWSADVAVPYP